MSWIYETTLQYRQVLGLGVLSTLPAEVRHRIYCAYFAKRRFCTKRSSPGPLDGSQEWRYEKQYDRQLLQVSKAIYNEACHVEKLPGVSLSHGVPSQLPPEQLRKLVTQLEIGTYDLGGPIDFTSYPALTEVSGSCHDMMSQYLDDYGGMDCMDDILQGNQDVTILSTLQRAWSQDIRQGTAMVLDWQTVPAGISILAFYNVFAFFGDKRGYDGAADWEDVDLPDQDGIMLHLMSPSVMVIMRIQSDQAQLALVG